MESRQAYLERKEEEVRFLAGFLARPPPPLPIPRSIEALAELKFRLGAALKAERAMADWRRTETGWADGGQPHRLGGYTLRSRYQRADLTVTGPPIYPKIEGTGFDEVATIYAGSGMSSMTTLLAAIGRLLPGARLTAPPGAYSETLEALALFGGLFRLEADAGRPGGGKRVLLIDSCVPGPLLTQGATDRYDLVVFDTTCFAASSSRIRAVLCWAKSASAPLALVRSHAKLDSLGIEYGRLGSTVLLTPAGRRREQLPCAQGLGDEITRAIRLFGAAPVPCYLPPFAGQPQERALNARRIARILANGRRITRDLVQSGIPVVAYQHGLYAVLRAPEAWTLERARHVAARLTAALQQAALPVKHAGSFGFDFLALDGFPDPAPDTYGVRLAFADVPGRVAAAVSRRVARWWSANVLNAMEARPAA